MFDLERLKKVIRIIYSLSILSLILAFIGLISGGGELLQDGYMNEPAPTILMFVCTGMFVILLITGMGFSALSKDVTEGMNFLYKTMSERSNSK